MPDLPKFHVTAHRDEDRDCAAVAESILNLHAEEIMVRAATRAAEEYRVKALGYMTLERLTQQAAEQEGRKFLQEYPVENFTRIPDPVTPEYGPDGELIGATIIETISVEEFKKRYPDAKIVIEE